jgi:hypothetical protein
MEYPKSHKTIVGDLLGGKFLLRNDPHFEMLKQHRDFYVVFFRESFDYALQVESDYAYIISNDTKELLSRDICIFTALLSYELDKDGKNFLDQLQFAEFEYDQIDRYFDNTSYNELVKSNKQLCDIESRRQFYRTLSNRRIIEKTGEQKFMFTAALKVFIDFAKDFALGKLGEEIPEVSLDVDIEEE